MALDPHNAMTGPPCMLQERETGRSHPLPSRDSIWQKRCGHNRQHQAFSSKVGMRDDNTCLRLPQGETTTQIPQGTGHPFPTTHLLGKMGVPQRGLQGISTFKNQKSTQGDRKLQPRKRWGRRRRRKRKKGFVGLVSTSPAS